MGCTSSAPKALSANPSKEVSDKSIQFEEDEEENNSEPTEAICTETENRTEINVLPPSDTTEPVQLVRNNQSTASLKLEKDLYTNGHIVETEIIDPSETTNGDEHNDDAKLKLEEVVGKFFEIVHQDTRNEKDGEATDVPAAMNEEDKDKLDENNHEVERQCNSEGAEDASPSQSQSSRATRWEALADIAAELPPSLAVDPLTGQIYSLSK